MNISGAGSYGWMAQTANRTATRQILPGDMAGAAVTTTSTSATPPTASQAAAPADNSAQQFLSYMQETPAQRTQSAWLSQHGITQQQFDAMSPADKQKIIDKMQQEINEQIKQQTENNVKKATATDIVI
jgi:hypothetical protein